MTMHDDSLKRSFIGHGDEFRVLFSQLENRTAVHAYLLTGEKGTGKRTLAKLMGAALLCSSEKERPCGNCRNCILAEKGEHPDMILIEKGNPIAPGIKKERSSIPIEDIREMIRLCGTRSTDGNMHVVLIFSADRMTAQAQNCLLKTLEEPPPDTCFILVSDHAESLLKTVISRCRILRLKAWEDEYILSVLKQKGVPEQRAQEAVSIANGSIGKAMETASDENYWALRSDIFKCFFESTSRSDVLKFSNQWKDRKQDFEEILSILESYVGMLSDSRYGGKKVNLSFFPASWKRFSENAGKDRFVALTETLEDARRELQYSVNFQAVLERIIFTFMGEGNKWQ